MKTYEEEAQEILTHYLQRLYEKAGLQWDEDNVYEVAQIITLCLSEIRGYNHRLSGKLERLDERIAKLEMMVNE